MEAGNCPCGTERSYEHCCEPIHAKGAGLGVAAVALMRARYCAYVRGDEDFLLSSWHPDTRPSSVNPDPQITWLGLDVIDTTAGGGLDNEGVVEFRARYRIDGRPAEMHERSRFLRLAGQWVYLDAP